MNQTILINQGPDSSSDFQSQQKYLHVISINKNHPASITILTILSNFGTCWTIEESLASMISYERQWHARLVIVLLLMESAYFCLFPGIFPIKHCLQTLWDFGHISRTGWRNLTQSCSLSKLKVFEPMQEIPLPPCKHYIRLNPCKKHLYHHANTTFTKIKCFFQSTLSSYLVTITVNNSSLAPQIIYRRSTVKETCIQA